MDLVVSLQQFLSALALQSLNEVFSEAVSANKNSTVWIQYNSASCVSNTDALALLLQSTFGWTQDQLSEFFIQASKLPGGNCNC